MNLTNFNSLFEIFAGICTVITGLPFLRYAYHKNLNHLFSLSILHNDILRTTYPIILKLQLIKGTNFYFWKACKYFCLIFFYKLFIPKPAVFEEDSKNDKTKKNSFKYLTFNEFKEKLDRTSQVISLYILMYCLTILVINGYMAEGTGDYVHIPFSSFFTGKVVTVSIKDMTLTYVFFVILSAIALTMLGYKDRHNRFFYKTKYDVTSINSLGVSIMVMIHLIVIFTSQLCALYYVGLIKKFFIHPRLTAILICFLPFITIYFLFIRIKIKIRLRLVRIRIQRKYVLFFHKIIRGSDPFEEKKGK